MIKDAKEKLKLNFKKLLIFSGLFNIVFAFPLIIPKLSDYYLGLFSTINSLFNLGGEMYIFPNNPIHSLLINTAGIDLVLIGIIVIYSSLDPIKRKGVVIINIFGRSIFFVVVCYYILFENMLRIILFFGLMDLFISLGLIFFLHKIKKLNIKN